MTARRRALSLGEARCTLPSELAGVDASAIWQWVLIEHVPCGLLDLQVGDFLPLLDWLNNSPDGACCEIIGEPITDPAIVGEGAGIAVRQGDTELLEKLNKALKEIRERRCGAVRRSVLDEI